MADRVSTMTFGSLPAFWFSFFLVEQYFEAFSHSHIASKDDGASTATTLQVSRGHDLRRPDNWLRIDRTGGA